MDTTLEDIMKHKRLTNRLKALASQYKAVPKILDDIVTHAITGKTVIVVEAEPSQVFKKMGYKVCDAYGGWVISWDNPDLSSSDIKYMKDYSATKIYDLMKAFKPIREFFNKVEEGAMEAAIFGKRVYKMPIPKTIKKEDLLLYIIKVYVCEDVMIDDDKIVVRWDEPEPKKVNLEDI